MKIYTRTGDTGETALFGGGRVRKDHSRVRAYGAVDELNAFLGRALGALQVPSSRERLERVQHDLFALGAHLATPPTQGGRRRPALPPLPEQRIREMEGWIDDAEEELLPLKAFILPGGGPGAGELHVCRTVCRRAERAVLSVVGEAEDAREGGDVGAAPTGEPPEVGIAVSIRYLNRLSDLLFVLARLENARAGVGDVAWEKEAP